MWVGFAIRNLLPDMTRVTVAGLDMPSFYFDRHGWELTNFTFLMHNRMKDGERFLATHAAMRHHCLSDAGVTCSKPRRFHYGDLPANATAMPSLSQKGGHGVRGQSVVYSFCDVRPKLNLSTACPNFRRVVYTKGRASSFKCLAPTQHPLHKGRWG